MKQKEYRSLSDEEIIQLIRQGEGKAVDYLMDKYKNMVRSKAKTLYLIGADHEDLIQEGMIGLFHAIQDYDVSRENGFAAFASLCISRQIYKAIKAQNRKKNQPLNNYVSLDMPAYPGNDQDDTNLLEVLEPGGDGNPEQFIIDRESLKQLENKLDTALSSLEKQVFFLFREGYTYQGIAKRLGRQPKSIDNALQRIKNKLGRIREEQQEGKEA